MSEWKNCNLGDVVTLQRGHDLPKRDMIVGIYPVAGSNGIIGYHQMYTTKGPGVTIGRSGNIGNAYYYQSSFWAHNTTLYVKDFKMNHPKFIYYLLHSIDFSQFNAGSAVPTLNRNHVYSLDIAIPPLPEQKAIAEILSSLDDKIDLLHRNNKTLEAMAEIIFRQWFMEYEFINSEGLPYKQTGGSFYESEFGMIPVGWTTPAVSELIEVKDGTHDSPKSTESGYFLITSRHMKPHGLDFDNAYMISEADYNAINKRSRVERYDILISMIGTLGLIYYVQDPEINFAIKNIGLFKTSQKKEIAGFLYLFLKSCYGDNFLYSNTEGSTQEYIALGSLRNLKIIMPDSVTLTSFRIIVDPIFDKIHKNALQIRTLESLRDTLLPKLISGEIRVPV
jgi:type I restriction enzyme S subunit